MNITLDCLPCFVRHTIEVLREFSQDENFQKSVVKEILQRIAELDFDQTPPEFAAEVHAILRSKLNTDDPYRQIKIDSNELAERIFPVLEQKVAASAYPLKSALLYAIAGNIIDSGISARTSEAEVTRSIEMAENIVPAINEVEMLVEMIGKSQNILVLGDNAGEIVFDRLFLKYLTEKQVTYSVKGAPILNDALREDAIAANIHQYAKIVDTGTAIPGVVIERSSAEFRDAYAAAEVIIAKGQANFETLGEIKDDRIFFALRAKCAVIANKAGVPLGSFIVMKNRTVS